MGFKFRKSIKLLPGVKINLTEKGISSASIGKRGANLNIGKKGTRTTVGIPGSGLSYSKYKAYQDKTDRNSHSQQQSEHSNPPELLPSSQTTSSSKLSITMIVIIAMLAFILGAIIF